MKKITLADLGKVAYVPKGQQESKNVSLTAGKKMKDIVSYSEDVKNMIRDHIGYDFADEIPDEHEDHAEFVTCRTLTHDGDKNALYTGWMKNDKMHGRGTCLYKTGGLGFKYRYDGIWRNHKFHGKGRYMRDDGEYAEQGVFADDFATEGMREYWKIGTVKEYRNGNWVYIREPYTS